MLFQPVRQNPQNVPPVPVAGIPSTSVPWRVPRKRGLTGLFIFGVCYDSLNRTDFCFICSDYLYDLFHGYFKIYLMFCLNFICYLYGSNFISWWYVLTDHYFQCFLSPSFPFSDHDLCDLSRFKQFMIVILTRSNSEQWKNTCVHNPHFMCFPLFSQVYFGVCFGQVEHPS